MGTLRKLLLLGLVAGAWYVLPSSLKPSLFSGGSASTSETRNVSDFTAVSAGGKTNVNISLGDEYRVHVQASARGLKSLKTRVSDGRLEISQSGWLTPSVTVDIVMPVLDSLTASGMTTLSVLSPLTQDSLLVRSSGASTVNLTATLNELTAQSSGASDINIKGYTRHAEIRSSGSSDFRGNDFVIDSAAVRLSGSSDLHATVNDQITGSMSGSSSIRLGGSPDVEISTSGSSSIHTL